MEDRVQVDGDLERVEALDGVAEGQDGGEFRAVLDGLQGVVGVDGYDSASDKYFVKIKDVSWLIDSLEVHERISNGCKVMFFAVGLNFEVFDDENETLIVQKDDSEILSEMDVQEVKDKLREILNSFLSGTISHIAHRKQSQAMTALLKKMKDTDGRVLTAAESFALCTSEMFSVALAVEEFATVM